MIRAFNKHYKKAIDLLEDSSSSEKIEVAEKVVEWFRELPEEYLVSLALFFNEVIDDLGDESLEKISLKPAKKRREAEEDEETEEYDEEDEDDEDEDYDEEKEDY
jgi:hypothetical protein